MNSEHFSFILHFNEAKCFIRQAKTILPLKQYLTWEYRDISGPKIHTRKISNIHKDFKQYPGSIHNFLYQKESMHSNLKVPMHFGVEVWGKFGIENHKQKVSNIRKSFLSYTTYLWKVFYAKLSRNSPFTYYLHTQTTYYFINPIFCHDLPSTHSFLTWLIPLALT